MRTGFKILCLIIGLAIIASCSREDSLRDRTAIDYITNHFNHSHYKDYLTLMNVEVVDERVIHEKVFDMELHTLTLIATVDINESYVVSNIKYGKFLEIDRSWAEEAQMRINEAESDEQIEKIRETYLQYTFEKGVQGIKIRLRLTWNETEGRWMVLSMYL